MKAGGKIRCLLQCSSHLGYFALFGVLLNWQSAHQPHLKYPVTPGVTWVLPCQQKVTSHSPQSCPGSSWRGWKEGWGASSRGDSWHLSVLRWRVRDSAAISNNTAPDAACSSRCLIEILAELQDRHPAALIKWEMVHNYKPKYDQDLWSHSLHSWGSCDHVDLWTQCQWGNSCALWTQQT